MESETQEAMSSRACCNNFCNCANPFTTLSKPTISPTQSAIEFFSSTFSSLSPKNTDFTNHESLPSLKESYSIFKNAYPKYSLTGQADEIRARDFSHLSLSSHVCLDYIGHGLFRSTRLSNINSSTPFFDIIYKSVSLNSQLLCGNEYSEFETKIRTRIFEFMAMSQDDYFMVFTATKTSAFKLLADTYMFDTSRNLLTVYDRESDAVETMIGNAVKRGASSKKAEFSWPDLRIQIKRLGYLLEKKKKKKNKGLFVFPLQSSLSGARHSYVWMSLARENGWNVLLDASGLGSKDMETLGLSLFLPDFLFCSFYKIFGQNPSGFGCLFIKKSSISILNISKSVGIVSLVPPQDIWKWDENEENLVPNMGLEELEFKGLDSADSLGLIVISNRAKYLVNWLVNALLSLKYPNSESDPFLVRVYGPKIEINHGPALAFNIFDWKGEKIDPELVQKLADRYNISLSCGLLKNICFSNKYSEEKQRIVEKISRKGRTFLGIYVLNASLGFLSNFEDVYRLWSFVSRFLDADFVEKQRWRYKSLNQKTIEA